MPKDPKDHRWWICLLINRLSRAADEHKEQGVSAVDGRKTFAQLVSGKWLSSPSCAQARNGEGFKKPAKQHDMAVDSLVDIYSANNSFHHPVTRRVIDCAWLTKFQEASQDVLGHGHSRFFLKMEEPCGHADPNIDVKSSQDIHGIAVLTYLTYLNPLRCFRGAPTLRTTRRQALASPISHPGRLVPLSLWLGRDWPPGLRASDWEWAAWTPTCSFHRLHSTFEFLGYN